MKDYYFYTSENAGERLVVATSKPYFDKNEKPDEAETDDYVEFYQAVAAEGFTEIFPPLYRNTRPVDLLDLMSSLARKGIKLCCSREFDKAAVKLITRGPAS